MRKNPAIDELCRLNFNENSHSLHVCDLALKIFSKTCKSLKMSKQDRVLLEAAALLHDIGYANNPENHPEASADLVLQSGLEGFNRSETKLIAGIIRLHSGNFHDLQKNPEISDIIKSRKVKQLAAILRIADGLDHGHIQNAQIKSFRKRNDLYYLSVDSGGYSGNIKWAQNKSDLWNSVFHIKIKITLSKITEPPARYDNVLQINDSFIEAASKLMALHYRIIADNVKGALLGQDPEHLHDIRVAMRRLRSVINIFDKKLFFGTNTAFSVNYKNLLKQLGPIRDIDVWSAFLKRSQVQKILNIYDPEKVFVNLQLSKQNKSLESLKKILETETFIKLLHKTAFFTRIEIYKNSSKTAKSAFYPYASKLLAKTYNRFLKLQLPSKKDSARKIHSFRKRCRDYRYLFEFFSPLFGPEAINTAKNFKQLSDSLGFINDIEAAKKQLPFSGNIKKNIKGFMKSENKKLWKTLQITWRNMHKKKLVKRMLKELLRHNTL